MSTPHRCLLLMACALLATATPALAQPHRLGDRVLRVGAHGPDVRGLQRLLTTSGFRVQADGHFGGGTRTALRRFQKAAAVQITGVAGPGTVRLLEAAAQSAAAAPPATDGGATFGTAPVAAPVTAPPAREAETGGAKPSATPATLTAPPGHATLTPDGLAVAPADAPPAIVEMIAAANHIATLPYRYGGGHLDFTDTAYDCSGSASYALHGGGLLDTTLTSGSLASWGSPGPGRWATIYANDEHVYMLIAGLRFDTSGQRQHGSRWQDAVRSNVGFTVRHPDGL